MEAVNVLSVINTEIGIVPIVQITSVYTPSIQTDVIIVAIRSVLANADAKASFIIDILEQTVMLRHKQRRDYLRGSKPGITFTCHQPRQSHYAAIALLVGYEWETDRVGSVLLEPRLTGTNYHAGHERQGPTNLDTPRGEIGVCLQRARQGQQIGVIETIGNAGDFPHFIGVC